MEIIVKKHQEPPRFSRSEIEFHEPLRLAFYGFKCFEHYRNNRRRLGGRILQEFEGCACKNYAQE